MLRSRRLDLFREFFRSEKAGGFVLIACTALSLIISNSAWGEDYLRFWHMPVDLSFGNIRLGYNVELWINDGLMTIFFLLVGLEIERELYVGELSNIRKAMLPVLAAFGGMLVPAAIHLLFNSGTPTQAGFGIPMATDIAFALGILSLAGNKVPTSVKVFLTALAIIDDLGAITVIAVFYTADFSLTYFLIALGIFIVLFILGKLKVYNLMVYIIPGIVMWYCMLQSGVHATIAGVLLAFAIPFNKETKINSSYHLQHLLHRPVAFVILPLFALANTAIVFPKDALASLTTPNSLGIMLGLLLGKFGGILLTCLLAVRMKIAAMASDITWPYLAGVSVLAGIGFTMSIFITNLAFSDADIITASKLSILLASFIAGVTGLFIVKRVANKSNQTQ